MDDSTANKILTYLESHTDAVDADDWDSIYADMPVNIGFEHGDISTYLHELGFDPLPYMHSVSDWMYGLCKWIDKIKIPDIVTSIGRYAFYNCSLTDIIIPDSVTSIGKSAFRGCSGLTSIIIPDRVTSIDNYAFFRCSSLKSITIPNSVTSIGEWAFRGCSGLTSITYKGTKSQWNAIPKGTGWNYEVSRGCIVHCTNGDIRI